MTDRVLPRRVTVVEVGPRDGLQNEAAILSSEIKVAFIEALADAGLPVVEMTAFVSPKWVPQMADAADVARAVTRRAVHVSKFPMGRLASETASAERSRRVAQSSASTSITREPFWRAEV